MDTTPEYILMCERSKEIQALRKADECFEIGDYVQVRDFYQPFFVTIINREGMHFDSKHPWLPKQDQLQEMVSQTKEGVVIRWHQLQDRFNRFNQEFYEDNFLPCDLFTSFEQVWLAFVMAVKFAKRWDSKKEEWVKWR